MENPKTGHGAAMPGFPELTRLADQARQIAEFAAPIERHAENMRAWQIRQKTRWIIDVAQAQEREVAALAARLGVEVPE